MVEKLSTKEESLIKELSKHVGKISYGVLEDFILNTSSVYRPVAVHCFETWFENLMKMLGVKVERVGGDDVVDMKMNGKTLQLKTPYSNGTKDGKKVAFSLHKTHGLEKRPHNLYKPENFADFLVGKHPNGSIIICPRDKIPTNKDYPKREWKEYLADPAHFDWSNEWINRFDLLGVKEKVEITKLKHDENILFKKLGKIVDLSDEDIVKTLLMPENFRVLEQNLKGTIREWYFFVAAKEKGIVLIEPGKDNTTRARIKVDFFLKDGRKLQVKGRTKSLCKNGIIGVEVKGSHGRIPQRLYKRKDFDILAVVLDPGVISSKNIKNAKEDDYNFCIIPVKNIPSHKSSKKWGDDYLKDVFYFKPEDYVINDFSLLKSK